MKYPLVVLLPLIVACDPAGQIYSVRRAELQLELSCDDTGDCVALSIRDVPFERDDQVTFAITNRGERALVVDLAASPAEFSIEPGSANVAAGGREVFTVSYAPSSIDDLSGQLVIVHNATGPDVLIELLGTTDADADDDGFRHESAPGGNDCNDFNASVNPGQDETWYDGIDQDCDGSSDYDQDGDGQDIHTRPDGEDCDDEDPLIYAGAPDPIDEDGIDSDCDGEDG